MEISNSVLQAIYKKGELSKKNHPVLGVGTHWTTPK